MSNNNNNNSSSWFSKLLIAAIAVIAARTLPDLPQHARQIATDEPRIYRVLNASKATKVSDIYHDYFVTSLVTLPETGAWVSIGAFGVVHVFQASAYQQLPEVSVPDSIKIIDYEDANQSVSK